MKKIIFFTVICIFMLGISANCNVSDFSYEDFIKNSSEYEVDGIELEKDAANPQNLGEKLLKSTLSRINDEFEVYLNSFLTISVILILASVLSMFVEEAGNINIGLYGIYILCAVILSASFFDISEICIDAVDDLSDYMNISFSAYIALMISSGYGITANYLQGIFTFISGAVSFSISKIIIPMLYSCGIMGLANGVAQSDDISAFIKLILKLVKYILGLFFTLISAIMGFTGFTAISTDGLAVKTAKYAVSNFVPVVGSCLADTLNNVVYTSFVMKNTVGYIGFITILMICISPTLKIFIVSFMMKLISVMASMLHHSKMAALTDTLSSVIINFGALLTLLSIIFIIMIGIVISVGG